VAVATEAGTMAPASVPANTVTTTIGVVVTGVGVVTAVEVEDTAVVTAVEEGLAAVVVGLEAGAEGGVEGALHALRNSKFVPITSGVILEMT